MAPQSVDEPSGPAPRRRCFEARRLDLSLDQLRVGDGRSCLSGDGLDQLDLLGTERPALAGLVHDDQSDKTLAVDDGHDEQQQEGVPVDVSQGPRQADLGVIDHRRLPGRGHLPDRLGDVVELKTLGRNGSRSPGDRDVDLLVLVVPELNQDARVIAGAQQELSQ